MSTRAERRSRRLALTELLRSTGRRQGPTKSRRDPVGFQAELTARLHKNRMEAER